MMIFFSLLLESSDSVLLFDAESFVFQFSVQIYKD